MLQSDVSSLWGPILEAYDSRFQPLRAYFGDNQESVISLFSSIRLPIDLT